MPKNNLYAMEQNLRSIAKKYKTVKYSIGLVILFLMMGLNAFSQDVMQLLYQCLLSYHQI